MPHAAPLRRRKSLIAPVSAAMSYSMLIICLSLSVTNLLFMTSVTSQWNAVSAAWAETLKNYGAVTTDAPHAAVATSPSALDQVTMLYSVAGGTDIIPDLESRVVAPAVAYYEAVGQPLKATLIERKNASSKSVLMRLFFLDDSEQDVVVPFTGADGEWFLPDCDASVQASSDRACPKEFVAQYPEIAKKLGA